jgi:hypothetical protein
MGRDQNPLARQRVVAAVGVFRRIKFHHLTDHILTGGIGFVNKVQTSLRAFLNLERTAAEYRGALRRLRNFWVLETYRIWEGCLGIEK